jgi:hypothetical protein
MSTVRDDFPSSAHLPQSAAVPESSSVQRKMKMKLPKIAACFGVIVLFVSVAWVLLLSFPKQHGHLSITHTFGIGFDLSPSYAYVPPIVRIPDLTRLQDCRRLLSERFPSTDC